MKKTKLLIPALTIAGACTVVAPIVTSCGGKESSETQGVQVTETEFDNALSYFTEDSTHQNNYGIDAILGSVESKMIIAGAKEYAKNDTAGEGKFKWAQQNIVLSGYHVYASGSWQVVENVTGFSMDNIPTYYCKTTASDVKSFKTALTWSGVEFENGTYYLTQTVDTTKKVYAVTFTDLNGTKRVKRLSYAVGDNVKLIATFSNYGTSVLPEGFPE